MFVVLLLAGVHLATGFGVYEEQVNDGMGSIVFQNITTFEGQLGSLMMIDVGGGKVHVTGSSQGPIPFAHQLVDSFSATPLLIHSTPRIVRKSR